MCEDSIKCHLAHLAHLGARRWWAFCCPGVSMQGKVYRSRSAAPRMTWGDVRIAVGIALPTATMLAAGIVYRVFA